MEVSTQLIGELIALVQREAEATRRAFDAQWSLLVAERVSRSRCIDALEFEPGASERHLRFRCVDGNYSDFREGDLVRISRGDPNNALLTGNLHRVDDDCVWIQPAKVTDGARAEIQKGKWVMDRSYLDLESFYLSALTDLGRTARGRERILPLLSGETAPQVDLERLSEAAEEAEKEGVNDAQSEAISQAVATDLCHVIQGPPGTGKTFVLAQIVKQRLAREERILITAATHRAIHNALNMVRRVVPDAGESAMVKIGPEIYDPELRTRQYETFSTSPLVSSDGGYVVGATPFAARSGRLRGVEFDVVIIDEASQVTLPLAVMAMLSADTYLLIGDHQQLPPVVHSLPTREAHLASAFSRLRRQGFSTMLDITYRMNAELTCWPSENFYHGKLRPAERNAGRRIALSRPARNFAEILDPATPMVFVELHHDSSTHSSTEEATLVANLLEELTRCGISLSDIAVVVPFRRQARLIRTFLKAKALFQAEYVSELVIDTVERIQGQEREVVIVSMTASEPAYIEGLIEFLLQPNRLNVAVTRARSKVIVIGSEQLALADPIDPDQAELVGLWKSLCDSSQVVRI